MNEKLKKLYEEQNKLSTEMRAVLDIAEKEKRDMTAEENTKYEKLNTEIDKNIEDIQKIEIESKRREKLTNLDARANQIINDPIIEHPNAAISEDRKEISEKRMQGFRSWLRHGVDGFKENITPEFRALQADNDVYGGYVVTPVEFLQTVIKAVDNLTFMRGLSTVYTLGKAESLGAPSLDNDPADPTWTGEISTRSEDSTMSFGKRELTPHPLAKLIKVSKKLLRSSFLNIEGFVADRLGYKFAVTMENAYLNGSGSNQPLGVFIASNLGISTTYDISTGNTATEIRGDGLINALYGLKAGYQANASWIFHRDALANIRKLKDGNQQYIWQPGLAGDRPSTILQRPFYMSEYAPNTFTTGLYVGIIGDFRFYWIVDSLNFEIQKLIELYAATGQVGYIGTAESDGMPVLGEAFRRITLA